MEMDYIKAIPYNQIGTLECYKAGRDWFNNGNEDMDMDEAYPLFISEYQKEAAVEPKDLTGYGFYLFMETWNSYFNTDGKMEHDESFLFGHQDFNEWLNSDFNDPQQALIECIEMFFTKTGKIKKQNKKVLIDELEVIIKDTKNLNTESFFDRIVRSINNNGADRTASHDIYSIPLGYVQKVERYMKKYDITDKVEV